MERILNFNQFGSDLYESWDSKYSQFSPFIREEILDENCDPTHYADSLIDIIMEMEYEERIKESESIYESGTSPFKPISKGEKSERVKEVQKALNVTPINGVYGPKTEEAVRKFQTEKKIKVDGRVGTQTYNELLKLNPKVKTASSSSTVTDILNDPNLHRCFESVTVVVVGGETRIILIPKKDAPEKSKNLKSSNPLILQILKGAGKAIVLMAEAAIFIPIYLAHTIINSAISVIKFVAKGSVRVLQSAWHGLSQGLKWAKEKGIQAYSNIKEGAKSSWDGFCKKMSTALSKSKEGILAFAAAANKWLGEKGSQFKSSCLSIIKSVGTGLGLAWDKAKDLGSAVKTGFSDLARSGVEKAKKMKDKIASGYDHVIDRGKKAASSAASAAKSTAKSAVRYTGNQIKRFGNWVTELAESLYLETGDPIFEAFIY